MHFATEDLQEKKYENKLLIIFFHVKINKLILFMVKYVSL